MVTAITRFHCIMPQFYLRELLGDSAIIVCFMIYVPLISTILIAGWHEALKSTTYETAILVIACIQGIKADRKGEK